MVAEDEVRSELQRILTAGQFVKAPQLRAIRDATFFCVEGKTRGRPVAEHDYPGGGKRRAGTESRRDQRFPGIKVLLFDIGIPRTPW